MWVKDLFALSSRANFAKVNCGSDKNACADSPVTRLLTKSRLEHASRAHSLYTSAHVCVCHLVCTMSPVHLFAGGWTKIAHGLPRVLKSVAHISSMDTDRTCDSVWCSVCVCGLVESVKFVRPCPRRPYIVLISLLSSTVLAESLSDWPTRIFRGALASTRVQCPKELFE